MVTLIHTKEFIEQIKKGELDRRGFLEDVNSQLEEIQRLYAPFITINKDIGSVATGKHSGMIAGVPISVKDCLCTAGIQTTAGSKILQGYIPPFDATCVALAKQQGGIVIGKTAQDEFGFGTFSTNCAYDVPRNPYDTDRTCGGSSGGAACITAAAKFPHMAIAESTGGSITAPAAFTGTVGLTPTYGRVSRYGLIDYANSMDKVGVIAKEVYDTALMFSVIAGHDPLDSTSANRPSEDFTTHVGRDVKGMRVAVPKEYIQGIDEKIGSLFSKRLAELEQLGANVEETSLPLTKYAVASYYIIAVSEASTNLAKYAGMRYGLQQRVDGSTFSEYFSDIRSKGLGEEAKRRIILGTYARAVGFRDAYYLKALKIRRLVIEEFRRAFGKYDLIAAPSMPILPPKFSEIQKITPLQAYTTDKLTTAPNMAGVPTLSLPMGLVQGLPAGMQLIANHFEEAKLFRLGGKIEELSWMQ